MERTIKKIGLDVHKNSISIAIADEGRDGEISAWKKTPKYLKNQGDATTTQKRRK